MKRLARSSLRIYALNFLRWRKAQGGAVANSHLSEASRESCSKASVYASHRPLDSIVRDMGEGRFQKFSEME